MELPTFQSNMARLVAAFGHELSREQGAVYFEALSDLPDGDFETACRAAVAELSFFPKVAELRRLAGAATAGPRAESREQQALRIKRSALVRGFVPANWDRERYEAECRALGIEPKPAGVPALEAGV
jgi:hypothetical protein